jgi:hypothetical protein
MMLVPAATRLKATATEKAIEAYAYILLSVQLDARLVRKVVAGAYEHSRSCAPLR